MAEPVMPSLPGSRRWSIAPEKIGDVGIDSNNDQWIWLPHGLRWVEMPEHTHWPEPDEREPDSSMVEALRDVAREWR